MLNTLGDLFGIAGDPEALHIAMAYRAIAAVEAVVIIYLWLKMKWRKK